MKLGLGVYIMRTYRLALIGFGNVGQGLPKFCGIEAPT